MPEVEVDSHDDLQAIVAALTAASAIGGPVQPEALGTRTREIVSEHGTPARIEGFIWNIRPLSGNPQRTNIPPTLTADALSKQRTSRGGPRIRVTQRVLNQVAKAGASQAQIAIRSLGSGSKENRVHVSFRVHGEVYSLWIGDATAVWRSHQGVDTGESFRILFDWLSERVDEWVFVEIEPPSTTDSTDDLRNPPSPPSPSSEG